MLSRRCLRATWIFAIALLALLALKAFVVDVYPVISPSMSPTIRPGEWVLVRFDTSRVERGEVVVIRRAGELVVKRAIGVGPETILIDDFGDVLIDDKALPLSWEERAGVLLFDSDKSSIEQTFSMGGTQANPWIETPLGWELDALDIPRGDELGLMQYHPIIHDEFYTEDGRRRGGTSSVGDVVLECDLQVLEMNGRLQFALIERGDTFIFTLELGEECGLATLEQRFGNDETLALGETQWDLGTWLEAAPEGELGGGLSIRFQNVDNYLRVLVWDEQGTQRYELSTKYNATHLHPQDRLERGLSFGYRVKLGGEGCRLRVRRIRIWRDLHYTQRGEFALNRRLGLGVGELFLLGDNSAFSNDSREWGPVRHQDLVGRASYVVWPPSSWRAIGARE